MIQNNFGVEFAFQQTGVLEKLRWLQRHLQIARKKILPAVRLFLGRLPLQSGNSICVEILDLAPKMTSTIWSFDVMKKPHKRFLSTSVSRNWQLLPVLLYTAKSFCLQISPGLRYSSIFMLILTLTSPYGPILVYAY